MAEPQERTPEDGRAMERILAWAQPAEGTVLDEEHTAHGTRLHARVYPDLAGVLAPFVAVS